jgi:hypothetical protein
MAVDSVREDGARRRPGRRSSASWKMAPVGVREEGEPAADLAVLRGCVCLRGVRDGGTGRLGLAGHGEEMGNVPASG